MKLKNMKDNTNLPEQLLENGFDMEMAMEFCADDVEILEEVLITAWEEGQKKIRIMRESLETQDYERYHIEAHALKNAAKVFGAVKLSAISLEQEKAAKEKQFDILIKESPLLFEEYERVLALLYHIIH